MEPNPREHLNAMSAQDKEGFIAPEPEIQQDNAMNKGREEVNNNDPKHVSTNHEPCVPYPKAMTKDRTEEQFGKFVKLLKKLHINLPFIEVLSQMPNSAKFLKELLSNKRKLDTTSHVEFNVVCSAILKNELPKN